MAAEDAELLNRSSEDEQWHDALISDSQDHGASNDVGLLLTTTLVSDLDCVLTTSVLAEQSVADVLRVMCDEKASAVLVTFQEALVGIFTERDVLSKIAHQYDQVKDRPIREFMTGNPETLDGSSSLAYSLNWMAVKRYRHIPVLEDGKPSGVIRVLDVLKFIASHC